MNYLPDFIIPGAAKAGTTSLVSYLRQHPNIYIPFGTGELHFFNKNGNYTKGISWYRNQFKNALPCQILGEKTPRYSELFVPKRMAKYLPDVKLIWMFRNPVERAFSHYKMYVWSGVEPFSFERALQLEEKRILQGENMYNYKELGKYVLSVKEYLKYYGKEKMLFIIFEEFIENPMKIMTQITDFLGLKSYDGYTLRHELKAKFPKSIKYQVFIRNLVYGSLGGKWKGIYPVRLRNFIFNSLASLNETKINLHKMNPNTRKYLIDYYKPFNQELGKIIERDLSIWNK